MWDLLALGTLDVRLIGDEGQALRIFIELIGPILIAGAAVLAARTARDSASERQERQLAHDTDRQKEALEHDRKMRERESTRIVLDEAIEAAHRIVPMYTLWERHVEEMQEAMADSKRAHQVEGLKKQYVDKASEAIDAATDLAYHELRVRSRPGADSLSDIYGDLVDNYRKHRDCLTKGMVNQLDQEELMNIKQIDKAGTKAMAKLLTGWRAWLDGGTE